MYGIAYATAIASTIISGLIEVHNDFLVLACPGCPGIAAVMWAVFVHQKHCVHYMFIRYADIAVALLCNKFIISVQLWFCFCLQCFDFRWLGGRKGIRPVKKLSSGVLA